METPQHSPIKDSGQSELPFFFVISSPREQVKYKQTSTQKASLQNTRVTENLQSSCALRMSILASDFHMLLMMLGMGKTVPPSNKAIRPPFCLAFTQKTHLWHQLASWPQAIEFSFLSLNFLMQTFPQIDTILPTLFFCLPEGSAYASSGVPAHASLSKVSLCTGNENVQKKQRKLSSQLTLLNSILPVYCSDFPASLQLSSWP